ncbi:hypothetical protein [Geminocystis herdmanii]|uniref:hypothetical protein n=1 Tax=Geminocystis herdmanii TaxID=669359 RepID=UPI000345CD96|nr:hypothetical protein [Geminocystis herdmanii]
MNNINDSDTIQDLEQLKNIVNDLLMKAEERITFAQTIQTEAKLLKNDLDKIEFVYIFLEVLGGKSEVIDLVNRLQSAEEFLNMSQEKYQNLEQNIQEELNSIKSFLTEKQAMVNNINEQLEYLTIKREEIQEYQEILTEEYDSIKSSIEPILKIINDSDNNNIKDLITKISNFQEIINNLKNEQEINQQKVNNNIQTGINLLAKKQQGFIDKQMIQENNIKELIRHIQHTEMKVHKTENHIKAIYEYLKLKPWENRP